MQQDQAEEKLKRLLADRELMTVESPADGIVYYGKLVAGEGRAIPTAAGRGRSAATAPFSRTRW